MDLRRCSASETENEVDKWLLTDSSHEKFDAVQIFDLASGPKRLTGTVDRHIYITSKRSL